MLGFLIPGPLAIICSWIPLCGFFAPTCMYVDRLLLGCTGTMTGGSLWGETGISGILAACLGGGS
jgi:hypothetical protein